MTSEFVAIASVMQHKLKELLEEFPDPVLQQAVLAETLIDIICISKDPQRHWDIALYIMEMRFKEKKK